jgi:hypothetical protein
LFLVYQKTAFFIVTAVKTSNVTKLKRNFVWGYANKIRGGGAAA